MKYGLTYRDKLRAISIWLEEEWDRLVAALSLWQDAEHHVDGTHADVTADSVVATEAEIGALEATAGEVTLDATGIRITPSDSLLPVDTYGYQFVAPSAITATGFYAGTVASDHRIGLYNTAATAGWSADIELCTRGNGTHIGDVLLSSSSTNASVTLEVIGASRESGVSVSEASGIALYWAQATKDDLVINSSGITSNSTIFTPHLELSAVETEDLRFPAAGINPPGAASDPPRDTTDGRLKFQDNADQIIAIQAQMPHGWKEGTSITPHVHWSPTDTSSGNVRWKLEWKVANMDATFPGSWSDETISAAASGTADQHEIDNFSAISMTGKTYSCMILFKLTRLASSDSADTYEADVKLLEFDVHYQHYRFGST